MPIKHLVLCPRCELIGNPQPLGEVLENGDFSILRRNQTTLVIGPAFNIGCGVCGEIVYRKEANGTISNNGSIGILGIGIIQGTVEEWSLSGTA